MTEIGCMAAVAVSALAYFGSLSLLVHMNVNVSGLTWWFHAVILTIVYALVFLIGRWALT